MIALACRTGIPVREWEAVDSRTLLTAFELVAEADGDGAGDDELRPPRGQ